MTCLFMALATLATAHGRIDDFAPRIEFPKADPASVGIDPAALDKLRQVVQGYIDSDEAVGAELAVIKNGKMVLRRGFGLRDVTDKKPMETGGIFCIRSMTKTSPARQAQDGDQIRQSGRRLQGRSSRVFDQALGLQIRRIRPPRRAG